MGGGLKRARAAAKATRRPTTAGERAMGEGRHYLNDIGEARSKRAQVASLAKRIRVAWWRAIGGLAGREWPEERRAWLAVAREVLRATEGRTTWTSRRA